MDAARLKTAVVFIIIFGCFSVLYPRLFHPLLISFLGVNRNRSTVVNKDYDSSTGRQPIYNDIKRKGSESQSQIRMTGHPGMHALSEMKKYSGQKQGSGGKGILGIVLPLYALGIVSYLIYTLSKLLFKKKKDSKTDLSFSEIYSDNIPESNVMHTVLKKQKDLEKLLWKADQEDIGDDEIDLLKKRLIETENQMTRILKAMDAIQTTMKFTSFNEQLQFENVVSHKEFMNKEVTQNSLEKSILRKRSKSLYKSVNM